MPDLLTGSGLRVPTVHLNGTSRDELLDNLRKAWRAVHDAGEAVRKTCPHDRDYYTQSDPDAGKIARAQHIERMRKLDGIKDELKAIAIAIQEQGQ